MKIEIEIDLEAIVREEVRAYVHENLVITNVTSTGEAVIVAIDPAKAPVTEAAAPKQNVMVPESGWEFAAKVGKRRSKEDIRMHELELELGRRLTPEEKGQSQAGVAIDDQKEAEAKEKAIEANRIQGIADEAIAAAAEELAAEADVQNAKDAAAQEASEQVTEAADTIEQDAADASAELAAPFDPDKDDGLPETVMPGEEEATIPETEDLGNVDSLFS